jgi:MFS family permease
MKTLQVKIGIFSMALLMMAALAIVPSLANIAQVFPEQGVSMVQMLLAIPSLTSLFASLAIGKLSVNFDKKVLALSGIVLIACGGLVPYFYHENFYFLLACTGVLGLGVGCLTTLVPSLIADNYDGYERGATFGQMAAFVSIGAVLITMIGGKFAEMGWEHNYIAYVITIPLFIVVAIFLPKSKVEKSSESVKEEGSKNIKLNKNIFILGGFGFMFLLGFNTFPNNIALHIEKAAMGDVSTASMASGLLLFSGLVSGLLFGRISKITGFNTIAAAFLFLACGLLITSVSTTVPVVLTGSFVTGFSLSVFMARAPFIISNLVDHTSIPMAIAVYSAFTAVAAFLAPFIINGITSQIGELTPDGAMKVASVICFIVMATLFISKFEFNSINPKKSVNNEQSIA